MFTHNYQEKRYRSAPENNSGKRLVEKQGYISAQQRIENLMLAGRRLDFARKEQYDFPDGNIDENAFDPTRRRDYDLADATQDSFRLETALKARQTAQEAQKAASKALDGVNSPEIVKEP